MDKERLEKLIEDQSKDVRVEGVTLFNAFVTNTDRYRKNPTVSNLRDWESSKAALEKFRLRIEGAKDDEQPLANLAEVLEYLRAADWKVTRTSLYRHHGEGKLAPGADGKFTLRAADKYARTFLKQVATGKKVGERMDELQRRKAELEVTNLDLERQRKELSIGREQGRFIPKEQMDIELASRAGVLYAGLRHWIQTRSAKWIRAVAGDMKKVGELINLMSRDLDEHINAYASVAEYTVVIEAAEEMETTDA